MCRFACPCGQTYSRIDETRRWNGERGNRGTGACNRKFERQQVCVCLEGCEEALASNTLALAKAVAGEVGTLQLRIGDSLHSSDEWRMVLR